MLSIENPESDLPCSFEISQLKSSDERGDDNKVALLEEVDLLKSSPKFSIRDYVFGSRNKNIKTNWPFSQKNLQLCLNHGVKDLLPPLQPRFIKKYTFETSLIDKENIIIDSDGEPFRPSDHSETIGSDNAGCSEKLGTDIVDTDPEIDSVPTDKDEKTSQFEPLVKKCRLIVKTCNGDNTSNLNCVAFPETMASKVCPVCKTFTSSSNTKLNAHIDQCLSTESTIKLTEKDNSKVIKHRVKPTKMRLMVDIYKTALHCTLEELDRRNGTSWATNSLLSTQRNEVCHEEKGPRVKSVDVENVGDEGDVCIDSNGTKIRSLSKFNEFSMSKQVLDPGSSKFLKGGKRNKFLSVNKKKPHLKKHQKCLKFGARSKKCGSLKPNCGSEICGGLVRNFAAEESREKEEHPRQPLRAQQKIKFDNSGNMRKSVCSKRTALSKKDDRKKGLNSLRQDLLVESERYVETTRVLTTQSSSKSILSSPESSQRMEISYEVGVDRCDDRRLLRKRDGFSSFGSRIGGKMEKSLESNRKIKRSRKDSEHGSCKDLSGENPLSPRNKPREANPGHFDWQHRAPEKPGVNWVAKLDDHIVSADQSLQNYAEDQSRVEGIIEEEPLGKRGTIGTFTDTFLDIESDNRDFFCPNTEPSMGGGDEMCGANEVSINTHTKAELDCKVGQENYFLGVDLITIPGPPGSFLPSPRGSSSEELQGNSSVTTTHDRDSSDSPMSAISTISNSVVVRSDSKSEVIQDEIRPSFSDSTHNPVVEDTPVPQHAASTGTEKVNLDEPKVNVIFPEKEPLGFKNDQPCCCLRKEGTKQGLVLNYKDSQLLKRRTIPFIPLDQNNRTWNMHSRPEGFNLSSFPSSVCEKVVSSNSASPSASNAVLRLMGKNLLVVNKDEDVYISRQLRDSHLGVLNDHSRPISEIARVQIEHENLNSFSPVVHENRSSYFGSSKSFSSHDSVAMFPRILKPNEFQGGIKSDTPWAHNTENYVARPHPQHPNVDSTAIPNITNFSASQTGPYCGGSPLMDNANFQMTPLIRKENSSSGKWNCSQDSSSSPYPGSLVASSSTIGHLRSSKLPIANELVSDTRSESKLF